ncbi:hypothetical protein D6825_00420 [Candidatus Woesearchaeota archaeon]|nr:MAG: hypothetical protein D6825_00420 [Candidatus Woesearchaeota archaeon]
MLKAADLISLTRIPLAIIAAFFVLTDNKYLALLAIALAALSDVADGYVARRAGTSKFGQQLDGAVDKVFTITVAIAFLISQKISNLELLAIFSREITVLPLAFIVPREKMKSRFLGKATSSLQFAFLITRLAGYSAKWLVATVFILGICSSIDYYKHYFK